MVKINREYLDPALSSINTYTKALIEKSRAQQNAVSAAAQAVTYKARSNLVFRTNISRGIMIALVLVGLGLFIALVANPISGIVRALREQPISVTQIPYTDPKPTPAANTSKGIPELTVPAQAQNLDSNLCSDNASFEVSCRDEYTLPNGSTYSGMWQDGAANGLGTISFSEGGSITGQWMDGALLEVISVNAPEVSSTITDSVTVFSETPSNGINSTFEEIVVGHIFNSINDQTWSNAYCYTNITDGNDTLRTNLSYYPSFDSEIVYNEYSFTGRYTAQEFAGAQQRCPYRRMNF